MKIYFQFCFILFLSTVYAYSQNPNYQLNPYKKLHQYNYEYWSTSNGLPINSLLHVYQSKNGYLWFTSYGGLIRFDGNIFTTFNKKNTPLITSNITGRIAEDTSGTLWITTQASGLLSMKDGKFELHGKDVGIKDLSRALLIDKTNTLWSASLEKGWFSYKNGVFSFIEYSIPLHSIEVRSICEGKNGEIYFGTLGSGLFRYKNGKLSQISFNKETANLWIYSLYFDADSTLWVGTSNGLFTCIDDCFKSFDIGISTTVNSIIGNVNNNIWLGTKDGIFRINPISRTYEFLGEKGLQQSFINDMTFDREGNLWLTSYKGGITKIKDGIFANYSQSSGLNGKVTNAICEIDSNVFLIGFDYGDINILENEVVNEFKTKIKLHDKRVRHIMKDSKRNIWISTYEGLLKISPDGTERLYNSSNGLLGSKIRLTYEDKQGNIWVGTRNDGAIKIGLNGEMKYFDEKNGLNSLLIMSINQGWDNKIYIGTNDGGINIIDNDKVVDIIDEKDGLPSNIIFNTYHDKDANLWIVMNGGLACLHKNKLNYIDVNSGLADDSPFNIIEDDFGNLWLPCVLGIMKLNKNEILAYFDNPKVQINCRLFNKKDGMFQDECNSTSQSIKASDGSLLFSTIDGVARINPSLNLKNNYIPNIIIENIKVNGTAISDKSNIQVGPGKCRLTFEFTSLSMYEPKNNQFRYKLKGYEDTWVDAENQRYASYTNLSPGYYTFQVIGSNNDNIWNTTGDSISFYVKPLFIQTNAFYAILFFTVFIIMYSIYLLRVRHYKREQRILEEKVLFRTHEILVKNQELEEQKQEILSQAEKLSEQKQILEGALAAKNKMFSIIAHDLRGPMGNFKGMLENLVNTPEGYSEERRNVLLGILAESAKSTFSLLENLLNWSKSQMGVINYKPKNIELIITLEDVLGLIIPFAIKKQIEINTTIDKHLQVYADEDMVKTIFRNLLMNAIKFTNNHGKVEITARKKENFIEIEISDNGVGMDAAIQKDLFNSQTSYTSFGTNNEQGSGLGLILCKEFVEQNGGKIWVESKLNQGTIFYFTLEAANY